MIISDGCDLYAFTAILDTDIFELVKISITRAKKNSIGSMFDIFS